MLISIVFLLVNNFSLGHHERTQSAANLSTGRFWTNLITAHSAGYNQTNNVTSQQTVSSDNKKNNITSNSSEPLTTLRTVKVESEFSICENHTQILINTNLTSKAFGF
jgi:hypothetical protein